MGFCHHPALAPRQLFTTHSIPPRLEALKRAGRGGSHHSLPLPMPARKQRSVEKTVERITSDSRGGRGLGGICSPCVRCLATRRLVPIDGRGGAGSGRARCGADVERRYRNSFCQAPSPLSQACPSLLSRPSTPPWAGYQRATHHGPLDPVIPTSCNNLKHARLLVPG